MRLDIRIQHEDFDVGLETAHMSDRTRGQAGAIASFVGLVRSTGDDSRLRLEHYPGMTEASIETVADRARTRWPLLDTVIVHRVGELAPGDQIVLVLVAAAHRAAAFAGCEFLMDYLKTDAVLWKYERSGDSGRWLEPTGDDRARRAAWHGEESGD